MLAGTGGEIILGISCIVIALFVVTSIVRSAMAGIDAREQDQQRHGRRS